MEKGFKYDFFISYKHGTLDSMVAGYIQKKLEHYKIPREIQKKSGKKKITRVFRDREELSVTANLTQEIEEQLKNTEYLIVICSPEARQSVWVNREVETFIQYRGMEYVLPVLIKGEPADSFPDAIAGEEILAADVRGKDLRKSKKKCKNELLRLIAPALSCSYDELRQRHRNYMFQRIAVAAVGVAIAGTGFATYSFRQAKRIDEEYQNARKNQARYLSEISGELLDSGDRMGALKTALTILPEGKNGNEALVLEQEGALNNALYSYTDGERLYFRANRMEKTDNLFGADRIAGDICENGVYYVTIDMKGVAYFCSVEEEKCVWKLDPTVLTGDANEEFYTYTIIDEDRVAFRLDKEIWIASYKRKEVIKKIPLSGKCEGRTGDRLVSDGEYLLFSDFWNKSLTVYNLETGKQEYFVEYEKFGSTIAADANAQVTEMVWNSKEKEVMLAMDYGTESEEGVGLVSYSFEKDKCKVLSNDKTTEILVLDDKHLAAIQYISDINNESIFASTSTYQFCIYDYTTGEKVWKEDALVTNLIPKAMECMMIEVKNGGKLLVFYAGDAIYLVDADTYEVIWKENYGKEVVGIEQYDEERLLVGFEDRSIYIMPTVPPSLGFLISASQETSEGVTGQIRGFVYSSDKGTAIQQYYREGKIVFLNVIKDKNAKMIENDRKIGDVSYYTIEENGEEKTYRCIKYEDALSEEKESIKVYEVGTSKLIYKLEAEEAGIKFNNIKIGMQENKLVLCYTKKYPSVGDYEDWKKDELHIVELGEGGREKYCALGIVGTNVLYTSDLKQAFSMNLYQVDKIDLTQSDLSINEEEAILKEEGLSSSTKLFLTADDKYLIVTSFQIGDVFSDNEKSYYCLKVWDLENNQWKKIDGKEEQEKIMSQESGIIGKEKPVIAVQKENGEIEIFDLVLGSKVATLGVQGEMTSSSGYVHSFFDHDEYYLSYDLNDNKISIWDIKKEKKIMEKDYGEVTGGTIYTDKNSEYFLINQIGKVVFYKVDKEHRFGEYAKISSPNSVWASFEGNEILWGSISDNIYYSKFYSFEELKQKAEKLLDGEVLTEEEKNEYFVSE